MKLQTQNNQIGWKEILLGELLNYEQPQNYIVENEDYNDKFKTPVLTAGKSFVLGYTNETNGIYTKLPVIIFDDFTTTSHFVDFKFKVKSSAMKMLTPKNDLVSLKYIFFMMQLIQHDSTSHKRYYLSTYQNKKILLPFSNGKPDIKGQERIVSILEKAEKQKERGKKADELLDEYLMSIFNEMFYNKGFEKVSLSKKELYENIFAGGDVQKVNLSKIKTEKFKFPIFTNGEKNKGLYGYTDTPKVTKPSITISARGTIGYPQIRNEPFYPAIRLIVLTPHNDIFNLNFLKYAIDIISFNLDGTSIPQLTIPMLSNSKYKIPLPPLSLQQKFAKIVEQVESMKENIKKTDKESEELFNSLMQKAFRGKL